MSVPTLVVEGLLICTVLVNCWPPDLLADKERCTYISAGVAPTIKMHRFMLEGRFGLVGSTPQELCIGISFRCGWIGATAWYHLVCRLTTPMACSFHLGWYVFGCSGWLELRANRSVIKTVECELSSVVRFVSAWHHRQGNTNDLYYSDDYYIGGSRSISSGGSSRICSRCTLAAAAVCILELLSLLLS